MIFFGIKQGVIDWNKNLIRMNEYYELKKNIFKCMTFFKLDLYLPN